VAINFNGGTLIKVLVAHQHCLSLYCTRLLYYIIISKYNNLISQFFRVIRYEDFSSDPYLHTREVLDFFGLNFHSNVQNFLDTHTKINYGGVSSTFRDTKTAPFQWMKKLSFEEAQVIQKKCSKAMKLWGYKEAVSKDKYNKLEPLIANNFTLDQWFTKGIY